MFVYRTLSLQFTQEAEEGKEDVKKVPSNEEYSSF